MCYFQYKSFDFQRLQCYCLVSKFVSCEDISGQICFSIPIKLEKTIKYQFWRNINRDPEVIYVEINNDL